ncbi:tetratricopeptide repeat protein [Pseudaestuariivita sp.]|uniref:tetratricopeptide repeat protein n=1 Tax=Pseudaestuariivita sp. TaxID=2211669 RepID=UPI004057DE8D
MRAIPIGGLCLVSALVLSGCSQLSRENAVDRTLQDINVVDESNLNSVMLTVSDPNEGVSYFQRALTSQPDKIELQRGLATTLIRAKRFPEAVAAWSRVTTHEDSTPEDEVALADALIRTNDWTRAEATLVAIPPTHATYRRYRLEAMIADSKQDWAKSDAFYETALGLTTTPASVLNNWGYSKLTRGAPSEAEALFGQAIRANPELFTAKNNLVLARGAQGNYTLPVIPMTQIERAQLLHTLGLAALKQGETTTARGLFREALDTHPQHFEAASRSLDALETTVTN